jgi:hypothetical protein
MIQGEQKVFSARAFHDNGIELSNARMALAIC